jgi:hypothetical protein
VCGAMGMCYGLGHVKAVVIGLLFDRAVRGIAEEVVSAVRGIAEELDLVSGYGP